jgi:hypothetical protein
VVYAPTGTFHRVAATWCAIATACLSLLRAGMLFGIASAVVMLVALALSEDPSGVGGPLFGGMGGNAAGSRTAMAVLSCVKRVLPCG